MSRGARTACLDFFELCSKLNHGVMWKLQVKNCSKNSFVHFYHNLGILSITCQDKVIYSLKDSCGEFLLFVGFCYYRRESRVVQRLKMKRAQAPLPHSDCLWPIDIFSVWVSNRLAMSMWVGICVLCCSTGHWCLVHARHVLFLLP